MQEPGGDSIFSVITLAWRKPGLHPGETGLAVGGTFLAGRVGLTLSGSAAEFPQPVIPGGHSQWESLSW